MTRNTACYCFFFKTSRDFFDWKEFFRGDFEVEARLWYTSDGRPTEYPSENATAYGQPLSFDVRVAPRRWPVFVFIGAGVLSQM